MTQGHAAEMTGQNADLQQAWRFLEDSDLVASADEVEAAVHRLAGEIEARLASAYPVVLVLMRGAIVLAGQLLPRLRFPLDLDYIDVSRYADATVGGKLVWQIPPSERVRGRSVLALDDILDGGTTLCAVRERVLGMGATGFACAVLAEKATGREKTMTADFVGLPVPDRFVFGCGMDARGLWRNLPEIRAMREP